jgi:FixJ family two-component response regulator
MPGMSGLELQKRLAATGWIIPIIFITAHEDKQAYSAAMEKGAVAFLRKPFDDQELFDAIHLAFEQCTEETSGSGCS